MSEVNPLTAEELARVRDDCEEDGGVYLPIEVARRFLATISDRDEAIKVLANALGDMSVLVLCEPWCVSRSGVEYKCSCGAERYREAVIAVVKSNLTAAAALAAAKEAR